MTALRFYVDIPFQPRPAFNKSPSFSPDISPCEGNMLFKLNPANTGQGRVFVSTIHRWCVEAVMEAQAQTKFYLQILKTN